MALKIKSALRKSRLFQNLSEEQIDYLLETGKVISYKANEIIIHEEEAALAMYVILQGSVEVIKRSHGKDQEHRLAILKEGDCFGEAMLFEKKTRSASVRALENSVLLQLLPDELKKQPNIHQVLLMNISKKLNQRIRNTDILTVEALQKQLEEEKTRVAMGIFFTVIILLLSLYSLVLKIVSDFVMDKKQLIFYSNVMIIILVLSAAIGVWRMRFPLSNYGLTLVNFKKSLYESILWSIPIIIGLTILKWLMIQYSPTYAINNPLFDIGGEFGTRLYPNGMQHLPLFLLISMIYILFSPAQEFLARGALQGSLQRFLSGRYNRFWSIIIASILFATVHVHLGMIFVILVFFPSLFWGVLYARQQNLIGVSVSHILIGYWALFVLNVFGMLQFAFSSFH